MKMQYIIDRSGTFSINSGGILLTDLYPCINRRPIRAYAVETGDDYILYCLAEGDLRLSFVQEETTLSIQVQLIGYRGMIHTLTVMDGIVPSDLKGVYQAAGELSASCGYQHFPDCVRSHPMSSRGLIVLDKGQEHLVCYVRDHTRWHQNFSLRSADGGLYILNADFKMENAHSADETLPALYFTVTDELDDALEHAASAIGEKMHARTCQPPAYHWCSWYYNYSEFNQDQLREYLREFPKSEAGRNLRYIQIDAGNCSALGDWLSPRDYWKDGLESAIHEIKDAGYTPGIWVGPYMVGNHSRLAEEHPDWLLRHSDGSLMKGITTYGEPKLWGYHDEEYYILDTSHPDAMDYLRMVFRTLKSWGVKLYKTDFMLWGYQDSTHVRRYTPGKTSVEYFRDVLQMIREEIGEESYWLGCISTFHACIGYVDAMRIGGDVGYSWSGRFNPSNMIMTIKGNYFTNHRFYQTDPDAIFFRDFHIELKDHEIEALALYAGMSGGCVYTSDPLHRLREDRRALLSFIEPDGEWHTPYFPCQKERRDDIVLVHRNPETGKGLVLLFNPTDNPLWETYTLQKLGFEETAWICEKGGEPYQNAGEWILQTPSHGSRLFLISEKEPAHWNTEKLWKNLL